MGITSKSMPHGNKNWNKTKRPQQELTHKNKVTHSTQHLAKPKLKKTMSIPKEIKTQIWRRYY